MHLPNARFPGLFTLAVAFLLTHSLASASERRDAVLEVFLKGNGPQSSEAGEFIKKTYASRPGVHVVFKDVVADDAHLQRFHKLAEHFKASSPNLPAFYVSGQFVSGWDSKQTPARLDELLTVEVFVRAGCPHCAEAKPVLFETLAPKYPGYRFVEHDIVASNEELNKLHAVAQRYGVQAPSVPAVHMCGRVMIGFIDRASSGKQWDDVLEAVTIEARPPASEAQPVSSIKTGSK